MQIRFKGELLRIDSEVSLVSKVARHLKTYLPLSALPKKAHGDEAPLRSELFSADQMEQHGKTLASWHRIGLSSSPDRLLARLSKNEKILTGTCELLAKAVKSNRQITLAGEWLLDNFYLIEEQIRTAKRHLPSGYSRELPRLLNGPSAGLPRVYDIALETISHGDGRVDPESLGRFVAAYQTVHPLKLGELWAIPIMLRLALIENLRRVGARMGAQKVHRDLAGAWADQMIDITEVDPKSLILLVADMARSNPPMVSAFVAELARRLHGHSSALAMPLTWVEQRLSESGLTIEQLVQSETQQQATNQVSISNSIGSLRFLGAMDWQSFVEKNSIVEQVLSEDPSGIYTKMNFATRDYYRHVVENMSKHTSLSESDLARLAIKLAQKGAEETSYNDRKAHVGFYLIDKGLPQLEQASDTRYTISQSVGRSCRQFPLLIYILAILLTTILLSGSLFARAFACHLPHVLLSAVGIILLLCTSQLATALVNWLCTMLATAHPLPKMDFSKGIPSESSALVVVPTMLASSESIDALIEALEVRFLANRDENLYYGLLTDLPDAQEENTAEDGPKLRLVHIRSIAHGTTKSGNWFAKDMPSYSPDWLLAYHKRIDRLTLGFMAASLGLTLTHELFLTFIKICSRKALSSAKAFTI